MGDPVRARLYREDHDTTDGRRLERTVWADEPLPLLILREPDPKVGGHYGSVVCGKVTDLRREDEGWVTGELHTEEPLTGLACEADFQGGGNHEWQDTHISVGARLRAVTLGTRPTWDGMWIE